MSANTKESPRLGCESGGTRKVKPMWFLAGFGLGTGVGLVAGIVLVVWAAPDESGTMRELREAAQRQHGSG